MRARPDGHHVHSPSSTVAAGTTNVRTTNVSRQMPIAVANPIWASDWSGAAIIAANVPARMRTIRPGNGMPVASIVFATKTAR